MLLYGFAPRNLSFQYLSIKFQDSCVELFPSLLITMAFNLGMAFAPAGVRSCLLFCLAQFWRKGERISNLSDFIPHFIHRPQQSPRQFVIGFSSQLLLPRAQTSQRNVSSDAGCEARYDILEN